MVHSQTEEWQGRDLSGYGKKQTVRGALTFWRWQREEFVRPQKEINQARHTHSLEMAGGGTCQDTERNWPSEAHSLSGDGRGRNLSGHGKKLTERGTLTSWRQQKEGLVSTQKKNERARHTHILKTEEGGTCQDTEKNWPSETHSLSGDGRWKNLSGHRKELVKRGTLTLWRWQRGELVRT